MRRSFCLLILIFAAPGFGSGADPASADESSARTSWFHDARFGLFVHWGLYSIPAGQWNGRPIDGYGEWIMHKGHIPEAEYELLAREFHPQHFDARQWVNVAKEAGAKYIVVTAKHVDGFCMWGTKTDPYNVLDATPFRRDPLKELAVACRNAGIRFGIYYAIMDWRRRELRDEREPKSAADAGYPVTPGAAYLPDDPRAVRYIEGQLKPQIRELIEGYDPDLLWFDGEWVPWWNETHGKELETFCRHFKRSLVINNRVGKRTATDGDYDTPEQDEKFPSSSPAHRPWERCMTLNDTWGFKKNDENWKPAGKVVEILRQTWSGGGNLLLNVGPDADGQIPPRAVEILRETGKAIRE